MMKHKGKRLLALVLTVLMILGGGGVRGTATAEGKRLKCTQIIALPEQEWQKTATFPDWKNYTDDTLAMNSMISFQGYHGQGRLTIAVAEETESFNLYVNGVKADSGEMKGIFSVDFSEAARDGINTLQISNILPLGLKGAVTVYIPYPEILPGEEENGGIQPMALQLVEDLIASDIEWGFPSAQLAIARNGRMIYSNAWGKVNAYTPEGQPREDSPAVTRDTLYDLASVTKMFSVNYAIQKLVTDGKMNIDTPIVEILGEAFAEDTLDFAYVGTDPAPGREQGRIIRT